MIKTVTWGGGGGSKKCRKSVTYYLNGPKHQLNDNCNRDHSKQTPLYLEYNMNNRRRLMGSWNMGWLRKYDQIYANCQAPNCYLNPNFILKLICLIFSVGYCYQFVSVPKCSHKATPTVLLKGNTVLDEFYLYVFF